MLDPKYPTLQKNTSHCFKPPKLENVLCSPRKLIKFNKIILWGKYFQAVLYFKLFQSCVWKTQANLIFNSFYITNFARGVCVFFPLSLFKTLRYLLNPSYLKMLCCYVGITIILLPCKFWDWHSLDPSWEVFGFSYAVIFYGFALSFLSIIMIT